MLPATKKGIRIIERMLRVDKRSEAVMESRRARGAEPPTTIVECMVRCMEADDYKLERKIMTR